MKPVSAILFLGTLALLHAGEVVAIYVSPSGNDSHPGTRQQPLRTLTRARDAVREKRAARTPDTISVYLMEGVHYLDTPLMLGSVDGGSSETAVVYRAFGDDIPIVSGGRRITGWSRHSGNIWKTTIPEVADGSWWFRDFFVNGKRAMRARWPNVPEEDFLFMPENEDSVVLLDRTPPGSGVDMSTAEAVSLHHWWSNRVVVERLEQGGRLHLAHPGLFWNYGYLDHAYEFIDRPGEWFLNKASGELFYYAREKENPTTAVCMAPMLEQLMVVRGEKGAPIENLSFEGIHFMYTTWSSAPSRYRERFSGDFLRDDGWIDMKVRQIPAAVEVEFAEDFLFRGCVIAHSGSNGICFGRGVANSSIVGSMIYDCAASGIRTGYRQNLDPDGWLPHDWACGKGDELSLVCAWEDEEIIPRDIEITDNLVHHCGEVFHGCMGLRNGFVYNVSVSHNRIHHTWYGGMAVQQYLGDNRAVISHNHVHNCRNYGNARSALWDGGAIYCSNSPKGYVVTGNYIHDNDIEVVFLDQEADNCLVTGNVWYGPIGPRTFNVEDEQIHGNTDNPTDEQKREARAATGPREPYRSTMKNFAEPLSVFAESEHAMSAGACRGARGEPVLPRPRVTAHASGAGPYLMVRGLNGISERPAVGVYDISGRLLNRGLFEASRSSIRIDLSRESRGCTANGFIVCRIQWREGLATTVIPGF